MLHGRPKQELTSQLAKMYVLSMHVSAYANLQRLTLASPRR